MYPLNKKNLSNPFTLKGTETHSAENEVKYRLTIALTALNIMDVFWKSDLADNFKRMFFRSAVVVVLVYCATTWTLINAIQSKLDRAYTRMLRDLTTHEVSSNTSQRHESKTDISEVLRDRRILFAGY